MASDLWDAIGETSEKVFDKVGCLGSIVVLVGGVYATYQVGRLAYTISESVYERGIEPHVVKPFSAWLNDDRPYFSDKSVQSNESVPSDPIKDHVENGLMLTQQKIDTLFDKNGDAFMIVQNPDASYGIKPLNWKTDSLSVR